MYGYKIDGSFEIRNSDSNKFDATTRWRHCETEPANRLGYNFLTHWILFYIENENTLKNPDFKLLEKQFYLMVKK